LYLCAKASEGSVRVFVSLGSQKYFILVITAGSFNIWLHRVKSIAIVQFRRLEQENNVLIVDYYGIHFKYNIGFNQNFYLKNTTRSTRIESLCYIE